MDLITYGLGDKYTPERFNLIKNQEWGTKPTGGLWSSPIDSLYGWYDWCRENDFGNLETSFRFRFIGNIYVINSLADLIALPVCSLYDRFQFIDFEKCLADGIDAIHLTVNGEIATRFSQPINLYGWDCESVLVMNPVRIKERVLCP